VEGYYGRLPYVLDRVTYLAIIEETKEHTGRQYAVDRRRRKNII